jgi:hypothetical protein
LIASLAGDGTTNDKILKQVQDDEKKRAGVKLRMTDLPFAAGG